MSKPLVALGSAAALLLVPAALSGCNQTYQSDNSGSAQRHAQEAHSTTAKVARNAERAARNVTASVTAVAKGVEKGVREGVQQGQHDFHSQQAYNNQRQNPTTTRPPPTGRSPND
jgi:flagellar biosynthesis/type III secretory pathway protein FliH